MRLINLQQQNNKAIGYFKEKNTRQNNYDVKKKNLSFGQIKPEMLFIEIPGFKKDLNWSNSMISVINKIASKFRSGNSNLMEALDEIKREYNNYFVINSEDKTTKSNFGIDRNRELLTYIVGKYRGYFDKASEMVLKGYTEVNREGLCHVRSAEFDEKIKLTHTIYNLDNFEIHWKHTDVKNIPVVMQHVEKLLKSIDIIKQEISKNSDKDKILIKLNKKIAEIHWYLANATPYERGSAGIADVLIKSIYESLNVQTGKWKKGLSADLEAFVTPLNEFSENYPNYFDSPPKFMK